MLRVENFAHIRSAEIEFGDVTLLVGPQGSGKSLLLQLLKLCVDKGDVDRALSDAGYHFPRDADRLDAYLGVGMSTAWRAETKVTFDGVPLDLGRRVRADAKVGRLFYIPAHRAMLLAEGWPAPFQRLGADTPAVARLFSQTLFDLFADPSSDTLFPVERRLKSEYRKVIDSAIFHGGEVRLERKELRKRLELRFGQTRLPFMTWTAGQREFAPLLLGLYHLLPPRKQPKLPDVDWVVIEEPEMGLHPQAIAAFLLLVLDLVWRGYRVVLSTHSPLILDFAWALSRCATLTSAPDSLYTAFGVERSPATTKVLDGAIKKSYRTHLMRFDAKGGSVTSRDISALRPDAPEADEADWGGLTGFSSRFQSVVADAANA